MFKDLQKYVFAATSNFMPKYGSGEGDKREIERYLVTGAERGGGGEGRRGGGRGWEEEGEGRGGGQVAT